MTEKSTTPATVISNVILLADDRESLYASSEKLRNNDSITKAPVQSNPNIKLYCAVAPSNTIKSRGFWLFSI